MVLTATPQLEAVKLRPVPPAPPSLPRLPKRDENPLQQLQPEVWAAAAPGARLSPAALRPADMVCGAASTRGASLAQPGQGCGRSYSAIGRVAVNGPQSAQKYS
jgi:hypothetical protein